MGTTRSMATSPRSLVVKDRKTGNKTRICNTFADSRTQFNMYIYHEQEECRLDRQPHMKYRTLVARARIYGIKG